MFGASQPVQTLADGKQGSRTVPVVYGLFLCSALAVYHFVANGEFSAIMTMAVMIQCLAFVLLAVKSAAVGSVSGISARCLVLEALGLACRLSSTTWLNGYLPVDASGDFVYQAVEAIALLIVLWLLYCSFVTHERTYQKDADTLPVFPLVAGCFLLAALLHADMNNRHLFDTLWMTGLFLSVVSVLPQLWLINQTGGVVQACTGHYIAMLAASRALSGIFMWYARHDITCKPWVEGVNHAVWVILSAHVMHLVLLGDFGFYYIKALMQHGLSFKMEIPCADMV
jgi:hypothetical protein